MHDTELNIRDVSGVENDVLLPVADENNRDVLMLLLTVQIIW